MKNFWKKRIKFYCHLVGKLSSGAMPMDYISKFLLNFIFSVGSEINYEGLCGSQKNCLPLQQESYVRKFN
jgi:hypothetical protein